MMEFALEFIREAGLRVPGIMGTTIGIVGALILGQAAVEANIVSPILVILVAVTGLASFAIPYIPAYHAHLSLYLHCPGRHAGLFRDFHRPFYSGPAHV